MSVEDQNLRRRIALLEQRLNALTEWRGQRDEARHVHRDIRLAKTVPHASYPDANYNAYQQSEGSADWEHPKFPIAFLDGHFTNVAGWEHPATQIRHDATAGPAMEPFGAVAMNIAGDWLPPNTLVEVWWQRGLGPEDAGEWWISRVIATEIILFELTGNLLLEGSAGAVIVEWDAASRLYVATNQQINVTNYAYSPGMFSGIAGYRGAAALVKGGQGKPVYEILWMEHRAEFIRIQLLSSFNAQGQAGAAVLDWWDGKSPVPPSVALVVEDPHGHWPHALPTALGWARWNNRINQPLGRYEVVECNQMAILCRGLLAQAMCIGQPAVIAQYQTMTFSTFGQVPPQLPTALNPFDLEGIAGDAVLLGWSETDQAWLVLNVQHHRVNALISLQYQPTGGCAGGIQGQFQPIAAMYCQAPLPWSTLIPLYTTRVATDGRMNDDGCDRCAYELNLQNICTFNDLSGVAANYVPTIAFQCVTAIDKLRVTTGQSPNECALGLEGRTRRFGAVCLDSGTNWETMVPLYKTRVATDGRLNDAGGACQFELDLQWICTFNDLSAAPSNYVPVLAFQFIDVLVDHRDDGTCVQVLPQAIATPCPGLIFPWEDLLCGVDCASGSGQ